MQCARKPLSMTQLPVYEAAIVIMSMGIPRGFGLWLLPVTPDMNRSRQTFSFAIAIPNICWGLAGAFAGMVTHALVLLLVLLAALWLYLQPECMVSLAQQAWACF